MPPKKNKDKPTPTPQTTIAVTVGTKNIRAAQFDLKHNAPKILVFSDGERFLELVDAHASNEEQPSNLSKDESIKRRLNFVIEEANQYFQHDSETIEVNKIIQMDWFIGAWYAYMHPKFGVEVIASQPKQDYNFMAIKWGSNGIEIKCNRVVNGLLISNEKISTLRPENQHLKIDKVLIEKHPIFSTQFELKLKDDNNDSNENNQNDKNIGKIGGDEIDRLLIQHFTSEFEKKTRISLKNNKRAQERLRTNSEIAKKTLSSSGSALIQIDALAEDIDFSTKISQPRLEMLLTNILNTIIDQLSTLYKTIEGGVDYVALVGGSANIPIFKKKIQNFFDNVQNNYPPKILNQIPPEEVSVLGQSIHILYAKSYISTKDITHSPSRIGLIHPITGEFIIAIDKETKFPISKTLTIESSDGSEMPSDSKLIIAEEGVLHLAYFQIPNQTQFPFNVTFSIEGKSNLSVEVFGEKLRFY